MNKIFAKTYYIIYKVLMIAVLSAIISSCSTTSSLPEDEQLYIGLKDITFDHPKQKAQKQEKGVITALSDAYQKVDNVFHGESWQGLDLHNLKNDAEISKQQRDSLRRMDEMLKQARLLTEDEVTAVLSIKPNNSFMGSARHRFPLPIGLWIYNRYVGSKKRFGRWMFNTFAANPKLISTVNPAMRCRVATNVLHNYGFFHGKVTSEVITSKKNPRKAKVSYSVIPGPQYMLDKTEYVGFSDTLSNLIRQTSRQSLLHSGDAFSAANLDEERQRLNTVFHENGFYNFQPTYITYRADTIQRKGHVQLQVCPVPGLPQQSTIQYHIRKTNIHLQDALRSTSWTDTIGRGSVRMLYAVDDHHLKPSVRYGILRRQIKFRSGDLYQQSQIESLQQKYAQLGIFSQVQVECNATDTTATCDSLDVDIHLALSRRYDAEFKANAATKSNGLVGPGLSWTMTRRNAFRGCEAVNFNVYGNYEWQTGAFQQKRSSVMNSYEYGTSLSLDYPYIKFGRLARAINRRATTSTFFRLEANCLNRARYFGRVNFAASVGMTYQRNPLVRHELTPFRLDYNLQFHSTKEFDRIVSENQALYVSMRNQFVPSMQYVLNMQSRPTARNPRSFTLTLKEAGNVVSGIYACFGKPFSQQDKHLFGVPFAQFVKAVAEFRDRIKMGSTRTYLAGRVLLGAVYSYGNSTIAPYNDMLSIGGANSIRAFAARSIGPGSYHPANGRYSYVDQIGDLKFEANLEYRFPIVGKLEAATFLDCGNVWLVNNNHDYPGSTFKFKNLGRDLALGTGLGLRYDLDFFVIRFDVGVGIHSPYETGHSGYYNMPRFGKSLGYHLAIGYPF